MMSDAKKELIREMSNRIGFVSQEYTEILCGRLLCDVERSEWFKMEASKPVNEKPKPMSVKSKLFQSLSDYFNSCGVPHYTGDMIRVIEESDWFKHQIKNYAPVPAPDGPVTSPFMGDTDKQFPKYGPDAIKEFCEKKDEFDWTGKIDGDSISMCGTPKAKHTIEITLSKPHKNGFFEAAVADALKIAGVEFSGLKEVSPVETPIDKENKESYYSIMSILENMLVDYNMLRKDVNTILGR